MKKALSSCGYPEWSFRTVQRQMKEHRNKKKNKNQSVLGKKMDTQVMVPYVKGMSEACARIYRKYGAPTVMRPYQTIRNLVVHPKDRLDKEETSECVYSIPCESCDKINVGETGRNLGVRMKEHRKEVEHQEERRFTGSVKHASVAAFNKSAITNHARKENHVIDWEESRLPGCHKGK